MSYYRTPFHLVSSINQLPFGSDVYVISDSEYKAIKLQEAEKEIDLLTKRAAAYRATAKSIDEEIEVIKKQAGLLPESTGKEADD